MDLLEPKSEPLLTIAIPTYNSIQYLPRVVESIILNCSNIDTDLVEVLISDNYSQDGTFEYLQTHPLPRNFHISRNPSNLGFAFQIRKLIDLSQGKFLWTLGSQDFLNPGGLQSILEELSKKPETTHLLLNFSIDHEDPNEKYIDSQYNFNSTTLGSNKFNFFRFLGGPAMALSANIGRTHLMQKASQPEIKFTNWAHLEILIKSLFMSEKVDVGFLGQPSFTLFRENGGWWNTSSLITVYIENYELISQCVPPGIIRLHQQYRRSGKFLNFAIDNAISNGIKIDEIIQNQILTAYKFSPYFWVYTYRKYRKQFDSWK
jgi:glycosyltransferase involved in cell wall biosynthesis